MKKLRPVTIAPSSSDDVLHEHVFDEQKAQINISDDLLQMRAQLVPIPFFDGIDDFGQSIPLRESLQPLQRPTSAITLGCS